jgi:hypothetical protein
VLALEGQQYRVAGEYPPAQQARSVLLGEFAVDVAATLAAAGAI